MKDGNLRSLFRQRFPDFQWSSIETAGTATGVPDSEFCTPWGAQGWIEFKQTHINKVVISLFQATWLVQRSRYNGNAWIAVRRTPRSKKELGKDELWLMRGDQAQALFILGLSGTSAWCWHGGPGQWNWDEIRSMLGAWYPMRAVV